MTDQYILLIEDNQDHELLALRALRKHHLANEIVVMRDGAEALDFLFARGAHAGRDRTHMPQLVLMDLKLPKIDGLEVLQQIRADPQAQLLPVVILTSSDEDRDIVASYRLGANSYIRKPVDFAQFIEATRQLGLYWLVLNAPLPRHTTRGT